MPTDFSRDNSGPAENWEYYATIDADVDLTTGYPGYVAGMAKRAARGFMVGTAGNLVVTRAPTGGNETLPVSADVLYPLPISAIVDSGTTAAKVIVIW